MGTHNLLLQLGQATFLGVIAPNPAAPAPSRGLEADVDVLPCTHGQPACLPAHIRTPQGLRVLSVPAPVSASG
jgi:hypothetical protein